MRQKPQGVRLFALFIAQFMCLGTWCFGAPDFSEVAREADFKTLVDGVSENYAYRDRAEKPWLTWQARFRTAVDSANTPEAYAAVLETALDELHDFHAEVRSRNPHRWLPVPTFADMWGELRGEDAVVIAVRRRSDAERAGIVPGDLVIRVCSVQFQTAMAQRLTSAVDNHDPKARTWALLSILTGRADEERRFTIRSRNGQSRAVTLPLQRRFDRAGGALSSITLPNNVGLIRFNNSLGDQKTVAAFDVALEQLASTKGLILDLRDVPSGGVSSVALGIMGRFVQTELPYQRHRISHYGQPDVERNWIEMVAPRGPFTYKSPVVLLVDHWTGSIGEAMAIGFDAMQRARVVGSPMAHLAGAVSDFVLPQTGVDIAIATEQLYHVDGTPRQDWIPTILVEDAATDGSDPIMLRGLAEIQR